VVGVREERVKEKDDDLLPQARTTHVAMSGAQSNRSLAASGNFYVDGMFSIVERPVDTDGALMVKIALDKDSMKILSCSSAFASTIGSSVCGKCLMN